jgi:hypothetical protein
MKTQNTKETGNIGGTGSKDTAATSGTSATTGTTGTTATTGTSQEAVILQYLQTGKPLTKLEALRKFGIWNTGDAIYKLRKSGWNIKTTMKKGKKTISIGGYLRGEKAKDVIFAEYLLIKE